MTAKLVSDLLIMSMIIKIKNIGNIMQMPVKFVSKQSPGTKPPQFYKSLELVTIVIMINFVIGGFSGEDLK